VLKALTLVLGFVPLGLSIWQIYLLQTGASHDLGADPAKALVHWQGQWALRFLILTLLVTPVRQILKWNRIQRVRRMLGLFSFFYASLHLLSYLVFLLELDLSGIVADVVKRPYITVGFTAYLMLIPLAMTSTNWMMRRLRHRWAVLHRIVYVVAVLAIIHLFWLSKASYLDAFVYGSAVAFLLAFRAYSRWRPIFRSALRTHP
jgi:sulfoxide reductase heme-binding subunit YedZ